MPLGRLSKPYRQPRSQLLSSINTQRLFNNDRAHEIGILCDIDVAVYLCHRKSGRLITYMSINR